MEELLDRLQDRSARGIARAVARIISSGRLEPGTQLPTVRALAIRIGVSPMTVSQAWKILAADGLLVTRGRGGTMVATGNRRASTGRLIRSAAAEGSIRLDLSTGAPDPSLLPDLAPSVRRVSGITISSTYQDDPVVPQLEQLLRQRWPFHPEVLTLVDGAGDALDRLILAVVRRGSPIMVETPTYPPLLDLLEAVGADLLPLQLDSEGIIASGLQKALEARPVALFLQPRAHNPTGISLSARRMKELNDLLVPTEVLVIEDDHAGDISSRPQMSLGAYRPDWTVRIASFSKSHGPDLRLAAVGGARGPIQRLVDRRLLGAGWSSRLLQHVLTDLLTDQQANDRVKMARRVYRDRHRSMVAALAARGVHCTGDDGINIWVEVADESNAVTALAAAGIGAARGSVFQVGPIETPHIRLTVATEFDVAHVADAVALSAQPTRRTLLR